MLSLVVGVTLVVFVFIDGVWTTLGLNRAGPLAGRIAAWTWGVLLALHRRVGGHRLLTFGGTITVLAVTLTWVLLLWAGWALIFNATPEAVLNGETKEPADFVGRMYFVGYTLVTLGMGDYIPQGGWRVVTILCSFHGLFELTLAISYLLPVLGAATEARQMAATVSGLGKTPQEILTKAWTGEDFGDLAAHLIPLTTALTLHTHAHQAYPILHYFHTANPNAAPPLRLAVLDEAMTLLHCAVADQAKPPPPTLDALRYAGSAYLGILESVYIEPSTEPPAPDLDALRTCGIPTVSNADFHEALASHAKRRRLLCGLVEHDGWTWDDVTNEPEEVRPEHALAF